MKEPKEKECIHCGGRLRKHGFQPYFVDGVEVRPQQYDCVVCHKKSVHYVGQVIPKKVVPRQIIESRVQQTK